VTGCDWNPRRSKNAEGKGVARRIRHLAVSHDPPPRPPPHGLPRFSRVGQEGDFGGALPAIGNEPDRGILPVASAVLVRAPDIALFLAFLA
jgi:hypothetical protein